MHIDQGERRRLLRASGFVTAGHKKMFLYIIGALAIILNTLTRLNINPTMLDL